MKKIIKNLVQLSLSVIFIFSMSCSNSSKNQETTDKNEVTGGEDNQIEKVVMDWNKSLNLRNEEMSRSLYAPTVFFYTKNLSGEECARHRQDLVVKDPSYIQEIISDIDIHDNGDGTKTASFTKQSNSKKGTNTYRAYLVVENIGGKWKIVKESDETTDKNVAKRKGGSTKVPANAVRGDFDGDGLIDNVWIEGRYDDEGYSISNLKLRSDNPDLEGLVWNKGLMGVMLVNLGDLNGSNQDFLGAVPHGMSSWCSFETYAFKNDRWKEVLEPFSVWMGDENMQRVFRADSPGYVYINYNDMTDVEDFSTRQTKARLKL